jgi:CHAT domain-containing protein
MQQAMLVSTSMARTIGPSRELFAARARRVALFSAILAGALLAMRYRAPLQRRFSSRSDMDAVVAAGERLDVRPSLARLSANFPYRPVRGRDADAVKEHGSGELWSLIDRFQKVSEPASFERRHAIGVAYLLLGNVKVAVATLEETIRRETNVRGQVSEAIRRSVDSALLNDLAAAYQAIGGRQGDPNTASMTLEAVQRAWKLEQTPQIAWTRAVVVETYHIRERSVSAWRDYLALDSSSEWSDGARQRLRELEQPTDVEQWPPVRARLLVAGNDREMFRDVARFRQEVRRWCEDELLPQWGEAVLRGDASAASRLAKIATLGRALEQASGEREVAGAVEAIQRADAADLRLLAQGHIAYGNSQRADRDSRVADSIREMDAAVAALTPQRTPFAWRARAEHAGMIYMSNDFNRTKAELQKLPLEHPDVSQSCRGFIHAMFGIVDVLTGSYKEAADHYVRGAAAFRAAGERDYEATLLVRLAEALDRAGEPLQASSNRLQALQVLERTGDPQHLHDTMYGAARAAIVNEQQAVADFFLDALVFHDKAMNDPINLCMGLMWRSAFRFHHRVLDSAASDLADTERTCRSVGDRSLRERLLANLELVKSALGSDESSTAPLTGLNDAIAYYQRTSSHAWLRTAYFARARRLEKRGDAAAAERDFQAALEEGDASRAKIDEREIRMSFTATADEIEDGYVEFLLRQHREEEAFEIADRRRLRELVDSPTARWQMPAAGVRLPQIQASLPFGAALIEYRVLKNSVVAWVVEPGAFTTVMLPVSLTEIEPAIAALESSGEEPVLQTNATILYENLVRRLEPLLKDSRTLVIVPDDDLERIAWSGLYDRVRQRWLMDAYATVVAPSAQLFAQSRLRWSERSTREERVVVIQAAAGGEDAEALPEAAKEARSISGLYRNARIIDGSRVPAASLLGELQDTSILQFVGHTALEADPSSRTLRLGKGEQSRLRMGEIAGASLPKLRLVYLSACESDQGRILKSEGSITLARSFFAAGVPAVVGTLWPIDDEAARLAARTVHQHLLAGETPAEALRQAQLTVASRGWKFRDWATLRVIGAGV